MIFPFRLRVFCVLLGALYASGAVKDAQWVHERELFLEARSALAAGDRTTYFDLLKALRDYPLVGYLRYEDMENRLADATDEEIEVFLEIYGDSPISGRLRNDWLARLAAQGRWDKYLEVYQGDQGAELQCYRLEALLQTGKRAAALDSVDALWMNGHPRPSACEPVFSAWREEGRMTADKVWARIRLAVGDGQWGLVGYLSSFLSPADRRWVEVWRRVNRDPGDGLKQRELQGSEPLGREIIAYGLHRLAQRDAEGAQGRWQEISASHRFPVSESTAVERDIALHAAYQHHPRAAEWLAAVRGDDATLRTWRVRAALRGQDWNEALRWIATLTPEEQRQEEWRYWKGRALSAVGREAVARPDLEPLSATRDYYGFLAADWLKRPYALQDRPIAYTEAELRAVESMPGITRARELLTVGMTVDARREWHQATRELDSRRLQFAAVLARRWGWLDQAILTVARSEHFDDLGLRFPVAHQEIVLENAGVQSLDAAWVYGILRQESAFWTDARSGAGAIGLMQLMPSTAAETARRLDERLRDSYELVDPARNIRLGSAYLKRVLDAFNGHEVLATAAYNAGPRRVRRWLPDARPLPADIWVDTIPLSETRKYVKHVLEYTAVYGERLGEQLKRLADRMPPVPPNALALTTDPSGGQNAFPGRRPASPQAQSTMNIQTICVLGGTGFVGRHLLNRLMADGYRLRALTRHRERHRDLLVLPTLELVEADVQDRATLAAQFAGCDAVINLVGILNERGRNGKDFHRVHVELPRRVSAACLETGVPRLLHMSALHADAEKGPSIYLRTKGEGEDLAHAAEDRGLQVTSFRPSVIFGPGDSFFNRFATLLKLAPGIFPLACPDARFAPVYVGDLTECFARALKERGTAGQRYDLCGPQVYSLKELVQYTARVERLHRLVVGLGDRMSYLQARLLQHVPGRPFSVDNYLSLQVDSVCEGPFPAVFGLSPQSIEAVVPGYLADGTQRARYGLYRRQAGRD